MRHSIKTGVSFGLTSGIITTLGLMVGLNSGTHSQLAVIGGILTIAFADAFSDALGIHVSEEAENKHNTKEIWEATISTFLAKLIVAASFIIPFLIFEFAISIIVNIIWGLSLLSFFSYYISKGQKTTWKVIVEHLLIAILVITLAHFIGLAIANYFGWSESGIKRSLNQTGEFDISTYQEDNINDSDSSESGDNGKSGENSRENSNDHSLSNEEDNSSENEQEIENERWISFNPI